MVSQSPEDAVPPLFATGFGVYLVIVALNAYNRGFDDNLVDLIKRAMGWLIIIACAFNATQYLKIANMLYELPEYSIRVHIMQRP